MVVNQVNNMQTVPIQFQGSQITPMKNDEKQDFGAVLKHALNKVSQVEQVSSQKTKMLATGQIDDLHDVMISAQKAKITVEAAVEVQQKMIDTYNEMMRMQI